MKKNQPKKTAAVKQSWQKGGAHRIAYEQRMQDKKTMDHRTSQPAAKVIGHQKAETASPAHYPMSDIVQCMRISARMLEIADDHRPELARLNSSQAKLLRAAADDLEAQAGDA